MKAAATFSPTAWDEKSYGDLPKPTRMTKASVEFSFKGQMEGQGHTEYVMFYKETDEKDPHKSSAVYVGLTRFVGSVNGKSGSFVMEERGTFEGGAAKSTSTIVAGSGTGDLKDIAGSGYGISTQKSSELNLEYAL
jgi:hypothetical protein